VYFRVLPFALSRYSIKKRLHNGAPVTTYFHPYDIDTEQERFMHPDLGGRKHLNMLMYIGRSQVLKRLKKLRQDFPFTSYNDYLQSFLDLPTTGEKPQS
jgi:hypothetical protein